MSSLRAVSRGNNRNRRSEAAPIAGETIDFQAADHMTDALADSQHAEAPDLPAANARLFRI
jgi:hypothetical protein